MYDDEYTDTNALACEQEQDRRAAQVGTMTELQRWDRARKKKARGAAMSVALSELIGLAPGCDAGRLE